MAGRLVAHGSALVERARNSAATAEEVSQLAATAERLRARNQELETALAMAVVALRKRTKSTICPSRCRWC